MSASNLRLCVTQGLKVPPTTSYSHVIKQAVSRGLLTERAIPTLSLRGQDGSGLSVVVVLWLPDQCYQLSATFESNNKQQVHNIKKSAQGPPLDGGRGIETNNNTNDNNKHIDTYVIIAIITYTNTTTHNEHNDNYHIEIPRGLSPAPPPRGSGGQRGGRGRGARRPRPPRS